MTDKTEAPEVIYYDYIIDQGSEFKPPDHPRFTTEYIRKDVSAKVVDPDLEALARKEIAVLAQAAGRAEAMSRLQVASSGYRAAGRADLANAIEDEIVHIRALNKEAGE